MNILFLTLYHIDSINKKGIYEDLLREFSYNNHNVYVVSPVERRTGKMTNLQINGIVHILQVKTGNIQKTNIIEKGISTILLERQFKCAIKKYFSNVKFDLVLYSTPPITLAGVVSFIKKRDNAFSYLLLKDIFPQNAVDIGMMTKTGVKGLLYKYFRLQEIKLYALSDSIGCMSQANVDYVLKHNPEIDKKKLGVCPNSIEPIDMSLSKEDIISMRKKYSIPQDKTVFVYGGNLGKPQGISFLIECLRSQRDNDKVFFLIVGDGTDYSKLLSFAQSEKQQNVKIMNRLPKEDYDAMIAACDVGMIFLDYRFTIPNFPSRLLSYMQAKLPVLAVTDINTDIGKVICDGDFGWWNVSNSVEDFSKNIQKIVAENIEDIEKKGENGYVYMLDKYSTKQAYSIIWRNFIKE